MIMGSLVEYARLVLHAGHGDPFDAAVRELLADPPRAALMDVFIAAAHERMPSAGPRAAPRWHMLYVDASVLKVLARASAPGLEEDSVRECISTLDHAIIIAGAAADDTRRDYVVHDVIRRLQSAIPWRSPSSAVFVAKPAPVPDPLPASRKRVRTLAALPSITTAQQHCRAPFVIRGYAEHWPAMHQPHQWASLEYLFFVTGPGRIVPVEVGNDYRSDDWSQELISWEEFLSSLDPSVVSAQDPHQHRTLYLAQHSLLTQFPQLREDIVLPDIVYACLDTPDFPAYRPPSDVIANAWFGPKGTISPAHTDPFFNCYGELACCQEYMWNIISRAKAQVVGRKTVWLAPPYVASAMYPYHPSISGSDASHNPAANATSPLTSNTSQVDVFAATPQEMEGSQATFPMFWDTVPGEACCVTLSPGDLLFFPPGWWHAMRSEDVSFSVSMWF